MRGSAAFRVSVAPGGGLAPSWVRDSLSRNAGASPSLDLRFADSKSLVDSSTGANLVTFTRASSGTYVGSDGLIKTATTNLVTFSEQFDNAAWNKYGASVTANAVASPTGSSNASKLVEDTSAGGHGIYRSATVTTGLSYVWSGYFKAAERSIVQLKCQATGTVYLVEINLSNQTATTRSGNGTTTITDVGNGWYRVVSIATSTASGTGYWEVILCSAANTASYTGNGTSGLFLWGAQLEQSSTVGEYIPTTSTINSAPRFDHNPTTGESLGLLVEEQRTNLLLRSEELGTSPWDPITVTVTPNTTVAPDGNTTADTITLQGTGHAFRQLVTVSASTSYVLSFYARRGTATDLKYSVYNASGAADIISPTSYYASTSSSAWSRISVAFTTPAGCTSIFVYPVRDSGVTGTFFLWGAQLEAGSFPTSYIPTTTATVTRSADVASITGGNFSSWYNQTEGTVFAEGISIAGTPRWLGFNSGSGFSEAIAFGTVTTGAAELTVRTPTTTTAVSINNGSVATATSNEKHSIVYRVNDFAVSKSGGITSSASGLLPTSRTQVLIGVLPNGFSYHNGTIRRLTYWPQRLSNATLQQITR